MQLAHDEESTNGAIQMQTAALGSAIKYAAAALGSAYTNYPSSVHNLHNKQCANGSAKEVSVPDVLRNKNNNQPLTPVTSCQPDTVVQHTVTHCGEYVY
eukprot:15365408-Ditylum_brightwellii.AAC.1